MEWIYFTPESVLGSSQKKPAVADENENEIRTLEQSHY